MAAGTFFVTMDPHEVVGVDPDASGKLTIRFQGGAKSATVAGDLVVLDEFSRRAPYAVSVSAGYTVELATDVPSGGDPATSAVGYDLTWFNGDATVNALFTGQPAGSTVLLSDLATQETIPLSVSAANAERAEAAADAAAASAAAAATWDPENYVGKNTLVFRVDDHASIQAAITAAQAAGGGVVRGTPGETYAITSAMEVTADNVRLVLEGCTIDATGMPNQGTLSGQFALKAHGSLDATVAITSNLNAGSATVEVASTAGFAAGDLVLITSNEKYVDGATVGGNRGALHRVKSITDADTLILTDPAFFTYSAAATATIRKVNPIRGFELHGGTFIGGGAFDLDHCGIQIQYADEPVLSRLTANRFRDTAIQFRTVWGGTIFRPVTRDGIHTVAGQTGYGVSILDGSRHTQVLYPEASNSRHAITGGGTITSSHVNIVGAIAVDMRAAAFDCHEECWDWTFDRCEAYGGDDSGFGIRGQRTRLISPKSVRAGTHGIHVKSYDTVTSGLIGPIIENPNVRDSAGANIQWEGTADCRIKGGGVFGGRLNGAGTNNITAFLSDDLTLDVGVLDGATGTGTDGNNIRLVGTSSSSRCTNVVVRKGTYRNAVARWLRADFTDNLTFDSPFVVHSPVNASYLVSCTNVRRIGEMTGPASPGATTTTNSDSSITLTPMASSTLRIHNGTLTADRTVTLSTNNAFAGARFRVVRTGGGAFNLSVGGLKNLVQNTWAEVEYSGTAWVLVGYGTL